MANIQLEIVTPTGKVLDVETTEVIIPGAAGELGILPGHRAALLKLGGGAVRFNNKMVFIRGGVAEVREGGGVLILADEAVPQESADRSAAEALLEKVTAELTNAEFLDAESMVRLGSDRAYAEAVLKVAGH